MLEVSQLKVRLGTIRVLENVEFQVAPGQLCGIVGHNGAGKTTLLRTILGLVRPISGVVRFEGTDISSRPGHARVQLGIGYMPEDRRLVPSLSAEENLAAPAWAMKYPDTGERLEWIYQAIPEIKPLREKPASSLSGGQQKLIALARALMAGRRLLLLDEPTEGVAPVLAQRLLQILRTSLPPEIAVLITESNETAFGIAFDREFNLERGVLTDRGRAGRVSESVEGVKT